MELRARINRVSSHDVIFEANIMLLCVRSYLLYPLGILLRSEVGALAMSASSIKVATNTVLLKSVEKKLRA